MRRLSLDEFKAERDALFRDMTLERATAQWNALGFEPPVDPMVPLATAHKARLQWLDATDAMLAESAAWLKDHDCTMMVRGGGPPLTPATRDSERMKLGKPPLNLAGSSR